MKSMTILRSLLAAVAVVIALPVITHAQPLTISVTGTRNIAFGSVLRSGVGTVAYSSPSSAEFQVTGREKKNIKLTVTYTNLSHTPASLTLSVGNSDCAFSTDNGATWTTFTTGTLYQNTKFPNAPGAATETSVLVRVGGTFTASPTQQSGAYSGTITVTANYR